MRHDRCKECEREAAFVEVLRSLWLQVLTPCRELFLTVELRHLPTPDDMAVLLCVADVHDAPVDAIALAQVSMDMFAAVVELYRVQREAGVPDAEERLRAALVGLARPVVLNRDEARRVAMATRRLFPGLLEEALAEEDA